MPRQVRQSSFTGGEIAPELYSRTDVERIQDGVRRLRNFIVTEEGSAKNRPGTVMVRETVSSTVKTRLIPFLFGGTQNYVLEFGDYTMRVIMNGAHVLSGGNPYQISTPWSQTDLPYLKYAQAGDTLIVCRVNMQPRELKRVADNNWTITGWATTRTATAPSGLAITQSQTADATHVAKDWAWVVTSVTSGDAPEESLPSSPLRAATAVIYPDRPYTLTWGAVGGSQSYNMYRGQGGQTFYGYIGNSTSTTFRDDGQIPVYAEAPPSGRDPFTGGGGKYPQVPSFFAQRLWYANSYNAPMTMWASQIGALKNFDAATPPKESDGIMLNIASRVYDEIRSVLPLNQMLLFGMGSEWVLQGVNGEPPSPTSMDARPRSYWGSSWLDPVVVGDIPLFLTARDNHVREFNWKADTDTAEGRDLTVVAGHLFRNHTIVDWTYARTPFSTIWLVRDDGLLLSLGYSRQTGLIAWAWHDTQGIVENVCACPEGTEDAIYLVVRRTVNGATKRYIERMATRMVTSARTGVFLDCASVFSGINAAATTMRVSGGSYAVGQTVTITSSQAYFSSGNVGQEIWLHPAQTEGDIKFSITQYLTTTTVRATVLTQVPTAYQNVATADWALAKKTYTGLTHLEACTVYACVDGEMDGPFTVSGGSVTLTKNGVNVIIGRQFISDIELNDLADGSSGAPDSMLEKLVRRVSFEVVDSPVVHAGETFDRLQEWTPMPDEVPDFVTKFRTGKMEVQIQSSWNRYGRAVIRHNHPVPLTVIGVSREVSYGG